MATPTVGKSYTVVDGDTLEKIAGRAYGQVEKWTTIYNANQTTLKSGDPNLIFPGEIIIIPELAERKKLTTESIEKRLEKDGKNSYRLIIDNIEIKVESFVATRTMDTAADGWTARIAWNPGEDKDLDRATKPYGYQNASLYIGGKLKIKGTLYGVTPAGSIGGRTKNLEGFSSTADAIDSNFRPPYEVNNYTLRQRAIDLLSPFGINVKWDIDDDLKFDKMTASATDKIFEHLLKYAKQKGVLISSTVSGDVHFLRANVNGKSVGTVEEGQQGFLKYEAKFDGRKRFNSYKAIGQSPKSGSKFEIAKDNNVTKSRMMTFTAPDSTEGDLKNAAEWQRSSQFAKNLTIPFEAVGWYAPNGEQWEENTIVTVKSNVISIPEGFNFLINRVLFRLGSSGRTTELSLVPPQTYSGEPIPDIFK